MSPLKSYCSVVQSRFCMVYADKAGLVTLVLLLALYLLKILNRFLTTLSYPAKIYEKNVIAIFTDAYQYGKRH